MDIGSNTVKMTVFGCDGSGSPTEYFHDADTVRIGHRLSTTGCIETDREERLIQSLRRMEHDARRFGATRLMGVATQAFRQARNGSDVVRAIHDRTDWRIEIISGEKETELTYQAALPFLTPGARTIIADIGGASTELILVSTHGELEASTSVPLGSGTLFDAHIGEVPPPPGTMDVAREQAISCLRDVSMLPPTVEALLLPGGSGHFLQELATSIQSNAVLDADGLALLDSWLSTSEAQPTAERLGIQLERAQVLTSSLAIVQALFELLDPDRLAPLPSGIRLGVAQSICTSN